MFAKTIIDSDAFLDMPLSTQALYFHLSMRADDDGFINNPRKIQRTIGCGDDDLKLLIAKRFIIPFESGIVVIKHWKIHNYIQKDRYKETVYTDEKSMLETKGNKAYALLEQPCIQDVSKVDTQVRLGKDRLGQDSQGESVPDSQNPPTPPKPSNKSAKYKQIIDYLNEKAGTAYRSTSKATQSHINARLSEGFDVEHFKIVIDKKCAEWMGSDMQTYLRPETLFGTKFEAYLNAPARTMFGGNRKGWTGSNKQRDLDSDEMEAIRRMMAEP